jgi:hypothetical protein
MRTRKGEHGSKEGPPLYFSGGKMNLAELSIAHLPPKLPDNFD